MLQFNINDNNYIQQQDFSIPSPLIRYLMINMDSTSLKKLYQTCKYFYVRLQINVVDELCIANELAVTDREPYYIGLSPNLLDKLPNKLWLTNYLLFLDNVNLPKFFSKLYRCDLDELQLGVTSKFTMNDLKSLTQSNTIRQIDIYIKIYTSAEEDTVAPLEDILACLLSANSIGIFEGCCFTKNTMKKLLNFKFKKQYERYDLRGINLMPDADLMNQFLKKNLQNRAFVCFRIENENDNRIFNRQMLEKINAWTPEERKPRKFPRIFIVHIDDL